MAMNTLFRAALIALAVSLALPTSAQAWTSSRPDGHAPIGVMGDHTHGAREMMVSLRTMYMPMEGSRVGTASVTDATIVSPAGENFLVTPSRMTMRMDMLGLMVAPNRTLTLMAMVPFLTNEMDHTSRMSIAMDPDAVAFSTESSGIGDVSLAGLILLAEPGRSRVHAGIGASLPTGSIDATGVTPMSGEQQAQLPYPMQLGAGVVQIQPSLTYLGQSDRFGWGAQARGSFPIGTNDRGWAPGLRTGLTGWSSVVVSDGVSLSARVDGTVWGDVDGEDAAYAMAVAGRVVPTVFPELRNGERMDVSVGLNAVVPSGALAGLRGAVEVAAPLYQRLDGPQLETDLVVTVGAQYAFGF